MLPGKKYTPEDLFWIAWRRKWLILVPFVVVACATAVVSRFLPDRYRSETVIVFVPQRVPETYVRSTVTNRIEDRLQTIQQTIMSRTALEGIIDEFKLYPAERASLPMEDVVERMRSRDIQVAVVKGDAFRVTYSSDNAKTAQQVAEKLGNLFINESAQDRQTAAMQTSDFLKSQLSDVQRRLEEQEQKVADYRRRNAGQLPTERESNLQVLQNLQMQVQAIVESTNRDKERRILIERQLADLDEEAQAPPPIAPGDDPTQVGTTAGRLEAARALLRNLELRLKPEHPDVVRTKRLIRDLEAKAAAEALEKPLSPGSPAARPSTPEEAARQKRAADLRASLDALDLQLKGKAAEEMRLRRQIASYEGRVAATPLREAEMIALTRDYETLQKTYQGLLAKQEDSKVAADLEKRQIGELFKVIDPARYPEKPYSPNRPFIDLAGALGGLGLGLGFVAFLEYRDRSLRSEDDAVRCLSLPVLAVVPVLTTANERHQARRKRVIGSCAAAGFVVIAAAGALAWSLGWLSALR